MSDTFRIEGGVLHIADRSFPDARVRKSDANDWHVRGAHLTINRGITLSVQWGSGTYSTNHRSGLYEGDTFTEAARTAEVAVWGANTGLMEWTGGDTVEGWVTPAAVLALIDQTEPITEPVPSMRQHDS